MRRGRWPGWGPGDPEARVGIPGAVSRGNLQGGSLETFLALAGN